MNARAIPWVLVLLLGALHAHADTSAEDAAREYNRVAKEAFKAEDYEKAVTNFERAFELLPDPKVRLNLALANDNLNRLDEAKGHYEAFLRENPKSEKAEQVRAKLTSVEKRMKQLGKLVIQGAPTPDVLTLDGKAYPSFPVRVWLTPGTHKLHAEKSGHAPQDQTVEVKAGVRGEVRVELAAVSANEKPEEPVASATPAAPAKTSKPEAQAEAPKTEPPASTTTRDEPAEKPAGGFSVATWALRGVGGVGLAAGLVALLVAVAGVALSGGVYGVRLNVNGTDKITQPLLAAFVSGFVVLGAGLVLMPVLGGAGVAALVASFFIP